MKDYVYGISKSGLAVIKLLKKQDKNFECWDDSKKTRYLLKKKFKNLNYKKLKGMKLHSQEISNHSAIIAKKGEVRKILKKFQIEFSKKNKRCCIEGRDISTKILPNSDVKFYFTCNLNLAALRRFKELKKTNSKIKISIIYLR